MSFDNIPLELRQRPQWVTFSIEDGKKIPYVPGTNRKASSNKPTDWRTFEEAVADGKHIGYCFSSSDDYVFIDLDEDHPEIFDSFDSYSQRSISGEGIHIICRASFEGEGKHPTTPAVGLFQERRFCLMTGDIVDGRDTIKVVDSDQIQSLHTWLSGEGSSSTANLVEKLPDKEDEEIFEACKKRFDTFESLWNGNAGENHSDSDHALISMLADCSDSNEQVRRMWFSSSLCRPHRRNNKYVDLSLKKVRGKQESLDSFIDFESEDSAVEIEAEGSRDLIDSMPEGLLKDIANWHWNQSYYPLQEASISAVLATMGTVAGRNFQTSTGSGKGLNPWIVLVGPTACGKNEFQNGITKIFRAVSKYSLASANYMKMLTGPMASGEGLEDALAKRVRLNSYFPEWHEYYHNLVAANPAPHHRTLKEKLLDLFEQSSQGALLKRRIKARAKDEEEPIPVEAPCLVVCGETTPRTFYEKMTNNEIDNGFLPRFIILNVNRKSISRRPNVKAGTPMPEKMVERLHALFQRADELEVTEEFVSVQMEDEARVLFNEFANHTRDEALDTGKDLHNRAGLKAIRIAGLFAVAEDIFAPTITKEQMMWAIRFIDESDDELMSKFENGSVGSGQVQQETEIRKIIQTIFGMGPKKRIEAGIPEIMSKNRNILPYGWLKKKVISSTAFTSDKAGAVRAFENCLNHMTTSGELVRQDADAMEKFFGSRCGVGILVLTTE